MDFKTIISEFKNKTSHTNEELADLFGVSKVTINNWKSGTCLPDIKDSEIINRIAEITDVQVKDLVRSIMEQSGLNFNLKTEVNPFYSHFKNKNTEFYKMNKYEAEAFLMEDLVYRNVCDNNANFIFVMQKGIKEYFNTYHRGVEIYRSSPVGEPIRRFIRDYLLSEGHDEFDPAMLTNSELYEFLDLTEDAGKIVKTIIEFDEACESFNKMREKCKEFDEPESYEMEKEAEAVQDNYDEKQKFFEDLSEEYVVKCSQAMPGETERFIKALDRYHKEKAKREEKMVRIRELQELYDKKSYPDLPFPEKPTDMISFCYGFKTKKAEKLMELYNATHNASDEKVSVKTEGYIEALEKYIGKKIALNGIISFNGPTFDEGEIVVLKDIYHEDEYIFDNMSIKKEGALEGLPYDYVAIRIDVEVSVIQRKINDTLAIELEPDYDSIRIEGKTVSQFVHECENKYYGFEDDYDEEDYSDDEADDYEEED